MNRVKFGHFVNFSYIIFGQKFRAYLKLTELLRQCGYSRKFAEEGASNESGVIENGDFRFIRSLYLPNIHIRGDI